LASFRTADGIANTTLDCIFRFSITISALARPFQFRFRSPLLAEAVQDFFSRAVANLAACRKMRSITRFVAFRNPPILANEDRAQYEDLKRLVLSDIKPRGLQEILLARDIVEAEWEVCRLRWKVAILHAMLPRVIQSQISEAGGGPVLDPKLVLDIRKPVAAFVAGDPKAQRQLDALLTGHRLTLDLVTIDGGDGHQP
jgi:hypothetical protein